MAILEVHSLNKVYTTRFGGNKVQALNKCLFFSGKRRIYRNHGRICSENDAF